MMNCIRVHNLLYCLGRERIMKINEYKYFVLSDLYRITGDIKISSLIKTLVKRGSYRYNFWMRTCQFTKSNSVLRCSIYPFARYILHRLTYKYGISIHCDTNIGSGFYIGHFGGIVVNDKSKIGKNCNISHGGIYFAKYPLIIIPQH